MNTPTPPKCLSIEINEVTGSMIRPDCLPSAALAFEQFFRFQRRDVRRVQWFWHQRERDHS